MNWSQKEKVIREKRTIEATSKNLMGIAGKIGTVAKVLGSPIVRQGGMNDISFLEDPYEDFVESEYENTVSDQRGPEAWRDEIKEMTDEIVQEEGLVFDGLNRGMHLEIKFWNHNQKLEVSYMGYEVYKEIAGELYAYFPSEEWEDKIDRLYQTARKQAKIRQKDEEVAISEDIERRKQSLWDRLRRRWGV